MILYLEDFVISIFFGMLKSVPFWIIANLILEKTMLKYKINKIFMRQYKFFLNCSLLFFIIIVSANINGVYDKKFLDSDVFLQNFYSIEWNVLTSMVEKIKRFIEDDVMTIYFAAEIFFLYMAYGFFLSCFLGHSMERNKIKRNVIINGFLLSGVIEVLQFCFGISFDIDSILLSVLGITFGFGFFTYISSISKIFINEYKSNIFDKTLMNIKLRTYIILLHILIILRVQM